MPPSDHRPRLGEMLLREGLLTREQLHQALAVQESGGLRLGEALLDLGFLSREQLDDYLNEQKRGLRLGDRLVAQGLLTPGDLRAVLAEQARHHIKFGEAVTKLGLLGEMTMAHCLAQHVGVPFIDLSTMTPDRATVQLLPETAARGLRSVPLIQEKDHLLVGMADPGDLLACDEIAHLLRQPIRVALVLDRQLSALLNRFHAHGEEIQGLVQELGDEVVRKRVDFNQFVAQEMMVDAPVVRILRSLFEDAVLRSASDIHIEPGIEVLRIRKRVDGLLHEQVLAEKQIAPVLASKLKLMAGLDISERRLPQDGRFNLRVGEVEVDVRLSTLPVQNGESVVMRILNQTAVALRLGRMGFPPAIQERFRQWIHRPHGLVLVVGPTGSGKSTTLYAALNEINDPEKKIITVEDPVEYRMDRINQVQINPRIGLTFPSVLRTVLRQDPDVVLVGEMRDQETIEIAIRAALTGHLVLSTLHTNDAPGTAVRLMDMAARGYALASSLVGVLAQRLVRRVCAVCARTCPTSVQERAWLAALGEENHEGFLRGAGCDVCRGTGYAGRLAVAEMLEIDDELAAALRREDSEHFLALARPRPEFLPLHRAALVQAREGRTTLQEAMRLGGDYATVAAAISTAPRAIRETANH